MSIDLAERFGENKQARLLGGQQLRVVADHLRNTACSTPDAGTQDLYARSAFNRYYYASYLLIRSMVQDTLGGAEAIGHKDLPAHLKGKFRRNAERHAYKLHQSGFLRHQEYGRICRTVRAGVRALVEILENAYQVRVVADYHPETKSNCTDSEISLDGWSGAAARTWVRDAAIHTDNIKKAWQELGF